jgi:hypothetical protein
MKRTLSALLVVGFFAAAGASAAEDVKAGSEPKPDSSATAPVESDVTAQRPPQSPKRTDSATKDSAEPAKDFAGDSSDQPKMKEGDAASSEEYTAALKKCDALTGTDKTQCVDAAKKKYGQT